MPKKLEEIKDAVMKSDMRPRKGQTKEQAAWAIATAQYKKIGKMHKKNHPRSLDELREIAKSKGA